jgi:pyrroline-5-carboxylate reductase
MLITFIGGGNIATALISGLEKSEPKHLKLRVCDPDADVRDRLHAHHDVETFIEAATAVDGADVIVLAVKPQIMPLVVESLRGLVLPEQLILSVAAGTTVSSISDHLGAKQAIVRAMPNTPALTGHGITGLFAGEFCQPHHLEQAEKILNATGEVVHIENESLMDVVTAVSGSGPAYYFLLTELLASAGEKLGLPAETANHLAVHTCLGAGAMFLNDNEQPADLRRRVTSPAGTTEAAMSVFEDNNFKELMFKAVEAATRRSRELAAE